MKKYGFAIFGGLLAALSFPTILFGWHLPDLGFLAWVALIPLFYVIHDKSPREAFGLGFVSAAVCNGVTYYWLYNALHTYGHINPVYSFLTLITLVLFMALYIGVAAALARWLSIKGRGEMLIWLPVLWTLAEWARNYTPFGGFPWANLAASQAAYPAVTQMADITGAYGLVFLIIWVNVWLAQMLLKREGKEIGLVVPKTIVTLVLVGAVLVYGFVRIDQVDKMLMRAPRLTTGMIQPNIPQEEKWDETTLARQRKIFHDAVQSLQNHADLIIWPEAALTEVLPLHTPRLDPQTIGVTVNRDGRPYTLLGLIFSAPSKPGGQSGPLYNSAALLDADGVLVDHYHKAHLVPFGEYIPFKKILSFLTPVAAIGDFESGQGYHPMRLGNFQIGTLICYEDIFPEIARTMAKQGANLLINITNDAWYGRTSAAHQHLALAALRSAETKRGMVRATNTGVTAVIDPTGKVSIASALFEEGVMVHQAPLLQKQTLYTQLGDWFIAACLLWTAWNLLKLCRRKSKNA